MCNDEPATASTLGIDCLLMDRDILLEQSSAQSFKSYASSSQGINRNEQDQHEKVELLPSHVSTNVVSFSLNSCVIPSQAAAPLTTISEPTAEVDDDFVPDPCCDYLDDQIVI